MDATAAAFRAYGWNEMASTWSNEPPRNMVRANVRGARENAPARMIASGSVLRMTSAVSRVSTANSSALPFQKNQFGSFQISYANTRPR